MARRADYATAYRLEKGWLNRGTVSLLVLLLAGGAVAAVVAGGDTATFRPGEVSPAHAAVIADTGHDACEACHAPFAGPVTERCIACHPAHPIHQPTQASTPPCGDCHSEHRGLDRLTRVPDGRCVDCHGDLRVRPDARPRLLGDSLSIHHFGDDHPDFALWREPGSAEDPNPLRFGHARHLEPLRTPEGETVELRCADCHRAADASHQTIGNKASGRMEPVSFEDHCQGCHLLTYDPGLPDEQAPHATPREVRAYLLATFANAEGWRDLSFEERRRRIATDPGRDRNYRLTEGERRAANRAEGYLFQAVCAQCHALEPGPVTPEVAPVSASRDWLPAGAFPHERHGASQGLACADCHDAASSRETTDVLLPGIDTCRDCHGEEGATAAGRKVPSACIDCHGYHLHAADTGDGSGNESLAATPGTTGDPKNPWEGAS